MRSGVVTSILQIDYRVGNRIFCCADVMSAIVGTGRGISLEEAVTDGVLPVRALEADGRGIMC